MKNKEPACSRQGDIMKKMILFISMIFIITSSIFCDGPATVNLGTSENYVILTKTGVTTTGTTDIVGNIGVSPIAATSMTGFGLIMDPSGTYSTSSLVTGNIYAADYASPTPAILTTAVLDMQAAYTDAAGRLDPDFTELGAGTLSGATQTLTPGLYKWSTVVSITDGITINGGPDDVWIFQITGGLTVATGAIVTLSGGARPENIFWQVSGVTAIGTTAQFKGIILCQTLISLTAGATVDGRLLAQTAVTLIANSVTDNGGEVTLPVELVLFTVTHKNNKVILKWQTGSEQENLGFVIERKDLSLSVRQAGAQAGNESKYVEIASYATDDELKGQGNTSVRSSYEFTDENVVSGTTYEYRISDVDYSGKITNLKTVTINITENSTDVSNSYVLQSAYPNPFNPTFTLPLQLNENAFVNIELVNILGQKVMQIENKQMSIGNNDLQINCENLNSGVYFVKVTVDNVNEIQKVVLLK